MASILEWLGRSVDCKARRDIEKVLGETGVDDERAKRTVQSLSALDCIFGDPVLDIVASYVATAHIELGLQVGRWTHVSYGGQPRRVLSMSASASDGRVHATAGQLAMPLADHPLTCRAGWGYRPWERIGIRVRVCDAGACKRSTGWALVCTLLGPAEKIRWEPVANLVPDDSGSAIGASTCQAAAPDGTRMTALCTWHDPGRPDSHAPGLRLVHIVLTCPSQQPAPATAANSVH
jgi:hypothetical protein